MGSTRAARPSRWQVKLRIFSPFWLKGQHPRGGARSSEECASRCTEASEEHRTRMLRFFKVARINVDAVTLVPCDETLNLNAAIRHAVRAQAPARTALVIADLPAKARSDSAPAFGKRMQSFAVGLPPMLLVQVRHTPVSPPVAMRNNAIHHVVLLCAALPHASVSKPPVGPRSGEHLECQGANAARRAPCRRHEPARQRGSRHGQQHGPRLNDSLAAACAG